MTLSVTWYYTVRMLSVGGFCCCVCDNCRQIVIGRSGCRMRKQLVLLRVRAESQQVSSQGAMDLLHVFDEARHRSKSDTFLERRVVYHERDHFIHHQRIFGGCEPHFSCCGLDQINGLFHQV